MRGVKVFPVGIRLLALALAILLQALSGCAGSNLESWARGTTVRPYGFEEVDITMEKGGLIEWDWSTEGGDRLDFNVHSHVNGQVTHYVERTGSSDEGRFTAPQDGTFSVLWENRELLRNVPLSYTLRTDGAILTPPPSSHGARSSPF